MTAETVRSDQDGMLPIRGGARVHAQKCQGKHCPCYAEGVEDGKQEVAEYLSNVAQNVRAAWEPARIDGSPS